MTEIQTILVVDQRGRVIVPSPTVRKVAQAGDEVEVCVRKIEKEVENDA